MKVLVTGATGFLGSNVAKTVRRSGYQVFGLVRNEKSDIVKDLIQNEVAIIKGDLQNPETYTSAIENADVIIHTVLDFANPVGTDKKFLQTLSAVAKKDTKKRTLIYTTGCSIYGKVPELIMDENTAGNPQSPLAFRMDLEKEVMQLEGYRKIILRPGFFYGKNVLSGMSAEWFEVGKSDNVTYYGDTEKGWSWVHIDDLADAYVKVIEAGAKVTDEIFCIADEQRLKCLDVFTACVRASGYKGDIKKAPMPADNWFGNASDQNEFVTSHKANAILHWYPKHIGLLDEIDLYYKSWESSQNHS
jgi:nucleoside-diphosphate-sugar epimerase